MVLSSDAVRTWSVTVKTFKCWTMVVTSLPNDVRLRLLHWLFTSDATSTIEKKSLFFGDEDQKGARESNEKERGARGQW